LLHRQSTGLVVRAGSLEFEVLRRLDGTDPEHVRRRLERECGVHVTRSELETFARHAGEIGLLDWADGRRARSRWQGVSWRVPLCNPDPAFSWCAPRTAFLFRPLSVLIEAVTVLIAAAVFLETMPAHRLAPSWSQGLIFLLLFNLVSIVHECGHGLALHRYGGHVREIGVRFVLGWPCWYCDITESYLVPRLWQRVAVLLAGPLWQAVVCAFVILTAHGPAPYAAALRTGAAVLGALSLINFIPFLRSDGYYLLTEMAGVPNLRRHAWNWVVSAAARHRMRVEWPRIKYVIVIAYAVSSAGFVGLLLGRAITSVARVFVGAAPVSVGTVAAAITLVVIATTVIRGRSITP
jgi:putative peptide zinc metalloprotease protein